MCCGNDNSTEMWRARLRVIEGETGYRPDLRVPGKSLVPRTHMPEVQAR